jgi:hypothetical protein
MSDLLTDESPQVYQPTLAAWIGLNEAIFLQQLHYIIVNNESVGKFADGRKWYRDKPRDFAVKYFPFWDESIVKRTITNLRIDGLLLVRSDLNEKAKDRSLWYTPHNEAINRLAGPVDRILGKSEKRKEARKARKSKANSDVEYTKVQNVPLSDDSRENGLNEAEVQFVPLDESTNCTSQNQQNVLLTEVQIVPTPKESLPKDSRPKDKIPPKGANAANLSQQMFSALANLVKYDLDLLGEKQRGQLNQAERKMRSKGYTPADLEEFGAWWYENDWRGKLGQQPTLNQIREVWKQFLDWRKGVANPTSRGLPPSPDLPPPKPPPAWVEVWEKISGDLAAQIPREILSLCQPRPNKNGTFTIAVPEAFKEQIDNRPKLRELILRAVQHHKSGTHKLEVIPL